MTTQFGTKRYIERIIPDLRLAIITAGRIPVSDIDVDLLWEQFLGLANREKRTDLSGLITASGTTLDPNELGKYCAITLAGATTIHLTQGVFGDEFHLEVNHEGNTITFGDGVSATSVASIGHTLDPTSDITLYTFLMISSGGTHDDWVLVAAKEFVK